MLRRLIEDLPQKKYVAFGSNKNDLSMLSAAELSYATVDAIPDAVNASHYQLKGHGGDSVVRQISRLYERLPWQKQAEELRKTKE